MILEKPLVFALLGVAIAATPAVGQAPGGTWTSTGPFGPGGSAFAIGAIAADPSRAETIYVGTKDPVGPGVLRSDDSGATFRSLGLAGQRIESLAVNPSARDLVYAGTESGLFRSTDGGLNWSPAAGLPPYPNVNSIVFDPANPSAMFASGQEGLFKSKDEGATWSGIVSFPVIPGGLTLVASSPEGTLYAAGPGLWRSNDRGTTWTLLRQNVSEGITALAIDPRSPRTLYLATAYWGPAPATHPPFPAPVFKTEDGGASWSLVFTAVGSVARIVIDPLNPSRLLLADQNGVFESEDSGSSWTDISAGLGDRAISVLEAASGAGLTLYAAPFYKGGVYRRTLAHSGSCRTSASSLCLSGGRFQAEVAWSASNIGQSGAGQTMPLTSDSGAFWFFQPSNIELVVKVLDGRAINGRFWVFYGALSNVGYTITVTDTAAGAVRTHSNPEGNLASRADTEAL